MRMFMLVVLLGLVATPSFGQDRYHHGGGGWHGGGGGGGGGHYGGGYREHYPMGYRDGTGGFLGGIIGGAIGSILFPPRPEVVVVPAPMEVPEIVPGSAEWVNYCSGKYKSFDLVTGTYLGFDGARHVCM